MPYFVPIRNFTKSHIDQFIKLHALIFPFSSWSNRFFFEFLKNTNRTPRGFILIKNSSNCIGFILGRRSKKNSSVFILSTLGIKKSFRGQKYANALVKKIFLSIKRLPNVREIQLHFREKNSLEKFYTQFGFEMLNEPEKFYSNGDKKITMRKIIP